MIFVSWPHVPIRWHLLHQTQILFLTKVCTGLRILHASFKTASRSVPVRPALTTAPGNTCINDQH